MKILCALSGIEFDVSDFPGTFYSREIHHPVFDLPQKKLLSYAGKWSGGQLTPVNSYLLFLSLLNSTGQVDFRVPAFRAEKTDSIVAANMEYLLRTVIKLNTVSSPAIVFPRFAITPETRFLENVYYWIQAWENGYEDFFSGNISAHTANKLRRLESALERLIKSPHKSVSDYAAQIADWAQVAGEFPTFNILDPHTQKHVPIAEYWKDIIIRCCKGVSIYLVNLKDLEELLEHVETNIPAGSIFHYTLLRTLRLSRDRIKNYFTTGDVDLKTTFTLLDDIISTGADAPSTELANLAVSVNAAPTEKPVPENYPTRIAYMRAKMRWDLVQRMKKSTGESK